MKASLRRTITKKKKSEPEKQEQKKQDPTKKVTFFVGEEEPKKEKEESKGLKDARWAWLILAIALSIFFFVFFKVGKVNYWQIIGLLSSGLVAFRILGNQKFFQGEYKDKWPTDWSITIFVMIICFLIIDRIVLLFGNQTHWQAQYSYAYIGILAVLVYFCYLAVKQWKWNLIVLPAIIYLVVLGVWVFKDSHTQKTQEIKQQAKIKDELRLMARNVEIHNIIISDFESQKNYIGDKEVIGLLEEKIKALKKIKEEATTLLNNSSLELASKQASVNQKIEEMLVLEKICENSLGSLYIDKLKYKTSLSMTEKKIVTLGTGSKLIPPGSQMVVMTIPRPVSEFTRKMVFTCSFFSSENKKLIKKEEISFLADDINDANRKEFQYVIFNPETQGTIYLFKAPKERDLLLKVQVSFMDSEKNDKNNLVFFFFATQPINQYGKIDWSQFSTLAHPKAGVFLLFYKILFRQITGL